MSLGEEIKTQIEIGEIIYRQKVEKQIKNKEWNGQKIKDMTDSHILNCIKWIESNDKYDVYLGYLQIFKNELKKRKWGK